MTKIHMQENQHVYTTRYFTRYDSWNVNREIKTKTSVKLSVKYQSTNKCKMVMDSSLIISNFSFECQAVNHSYVSTVIQVNWFNLSSDVLVLRARSNVGVRWRRRLLRRTIHSCTDLLIFLVLRWQQKLLEHTFPELRNNCVRMPIETQFWQIHTAAILVRG